MAASKVMYLVYTRVDLKADQKVELKGCKMVVSMVDKLDVMWVEC